MSFLSREPVAKVQEEPAIEIAGGARMVPRITIQAFCENAQTAELVEQATADRRMSKVALTTHNGGLEAAIETYRTNPTPNLVIIETTLPPAQIPEALGRLAEVCDATTRVVVLGHINDVVLYRELIRSGVSEYLVLPATPPAIVSIITELFASDSAAPIGRTIAFIGAKGGAGASTVAHNVAWAVAQTLRQDTLILDLDFPFGTAGLDFNQDPPHGLADAVGVNQKIDQTMLDRLTSKAANHVSLLTAPAVLDRTFDFDEREFEQVLEISQRSTPVIVLDVPHMWTSWVKQIVATVDEVIIVAEPDLANLRNTKNLSDTIKAMRSAESEPMLVINKVGVPKRPEIGAQEFATSVECRLLAQIAFDAATFGVAANNGQMIAETSSSNKANEIFKLIGLHVTGRNSPERSLGKGGKDMLAFLKRKRA